ncbi:RHS repeat-associated core domain-containing protein [Pseudomonas sp. NPDC089422]|uniref:RHS repeat-associated core domain-containing protein n=1 Tax=Pseudomonas sp. NPDC089422 TaxID=3364466 RepID=UPI00380976B1
MHLFYNARKIVTFIEPHHAIQLARANDFTLAIKNGDASYLISHDNQSTPTLDHSQGGEHLNFCPYGFKKAIKNSPFLYKGEFYDANSNGYPLGNGYRYYLPTLRIFNSPDGLSPFGAGGINSYGFAARDPVNKSDPTGHAPTGATGLQKLTASGKVGKLKWAVKSNSNNVPDSLVINRTDNQHQLTKAEFLKDFNKIVKSPKEKTPGNIQYIGNLQLSPTELLDHSFFQKAANRFGMPVIYMTPSTPSPPLGPPQHRTTEFRNANAFGTDDKYIAVKVLPEQQKTVRQR